MDKQSINMWMMLNAKYFESKDLPLIKSNLEKLSEEKALILQLIDFKDPNTMLIVSILVGTLGVDRFLLGDVLIGIFKLFTLGGLGIFTIIDWILIPKRAREKNLEEFSRLVL